jgi:hypothetical protein
MNKRRPEYLAYLLRLWRENGNERTYGVETAVWRASLQRPQTGERQGFASLDDLFAFLEKETKSCSPGSTPARGKEVTNNRPKSRGDEPTANRWEKLKTKIRRCMMKNTIGVFVSIIVLMLSSCGEPAATALPTATPKPAATAAPTATPKPAAATEANTPPEPAVVGVITSAEELAGLWHKTTRSSMGGEVYRQFTKDGIYRMGNSPQEIEQGPRVEGEFRFEGDHYVIQDMTALPGYDMCIQAGQVGTYTVELLDNGHIRFVAVEDECSERAGMLGGNEMEPVP